MSDAAAEVTAGTEGAQEAPQAGGVDLGPVMERFDGLMSQVQRLEALVPQQAAPGDGDDGDEFDIASLFADPEEPEPAPQSTHGLDQAGLQALVEHMTSQQQRAIAEALGPVQQELHKMQTSLDAEQLAAKYPDLANREIAEPVVAAARQLAEAVGQPELADNMAFIENVYLAEQARKTAAGERPVGEEQSFALERAGGAGPAAGDQPNIAQRLAEQARAAAPWRQF